MPKESRINPADLARAKSEWEASDTLSTSQVADLLGISKTQAYRLITKGKWVRNNSFVSSTPDVIGSKLTGIAAHPETRGPSPDAERRKSAPSAMSPAASSPTAGTAGADLVARPVFANPTEEMLFVEDVVGKRQDALVSRFEAELKALRSAVYTAARVAGTEKGFAAARTAKTLGEAFERQQRLDLQAEGLRCRRELGTLYGAGARPAVIIVHTQEGASFFEGNSDDSDEAIRFRNEARKIVEAARVELMDAGLTPAEVQVAMARVRSGAVPVGEVIDVDAVEVPQ